MAITKNELETKMRNGELKFSDSNSSQYEDCECYINKVTIEEAGESKIDHPLLQGVIEGCFLAADLDVIFPNGEIIKHIEVGGFLNKDGEVKCYPTFTGKDGKTTAGNLHYDLRHNCKEFSEEQRNVLEEEESFNVATFKDMKFRMRAKKIGEGKVILETSRQIVKDKEYADSKEPKQAEPTVKPVDEELPF